MDDKLLVFVNRTQALIVRLLLVLLAVGHFLLRRSYPEATSDAQRSMDKPS